jgi:type IX secretion system PorP/SprF family membrane protein
MKTVKYIIVLLLITSYSYSQQNSPYSHYIFNQLIINPAYAGTKQLVNINASYSIQWAGFSGSPSTQTISAEGPLSQSMGLGLHFINDRAGAQNQQGLFGSYSYILKFDEQWRLSMGLAVGVSNFTLDGTKLITEAAEDPSIPTTKVNSVRFDSKVGLFLYSNRFYAGFSVTDLLSDVIKSKDTRVAKQVRHYYLTSGYVFDAGKNLKIKPSFLFREDFSAPATVDINLFFLIKERFWLGSSVRFGANIFKNTQLDNTLKYSNAVIVMTEWNITKSLRLGYAYTLSLGALKNYSGHEIELGYTFPKKAETKMRTPRFF